MTDRLKVLNIEDSEDDALLIQRELRRSGLNIIWERVETAEALGAALETQTWDVIISDYHLPKFSAADALQIVKGRYPNLPFIVVSGTIGETAAVELMKAGAHDYLMKGSLTRLSEAVRREVREAEIRVERQRSQLELDLVKERLQLAVEGSGIGLWDWSIQTDEVIINERLAEIFGYTLDELDQFVTKTWWHLNHPEDSQIAKLAMESHFQQKTLVYGCEFRKQHKSGAWVWVLSRGKMVEWDVDGKPLRMTGTILDISDRKQTEAALIQSEAKSRAILTAIPDLMFQIGADGNHRGFIRPNNKINILATDFDPTGLAMVDVLPLEIANRHLYHLKRALSTGELQVYQQQIQDGDRIQDEEVRVIKISDDEALFIIRDISEQQNALRERIQSEQELRQTEQLFREAQRLAKIGNWRMDLVNDSLYWSDEVFRIFEIDPQQFGASYKDFLNAIHPDDREMVDHIYTQSLRDRLPYNVIHRLEMPDGRIKYLQEQGEATYSEDGSPMISQGTVQDITQLKQVELELQQLNQKLESKVEERTQELLQVNSLLQISKNRFSRVFDSNIAGMMFTDFGGQINDANDRFLEMFGYTREELKANLINWETMTPPEYQQKDLEIIEYLKRNQAIAPWEKAYYHKDGHIVPVLIAVALLSEDGSCVCLILDISDRKQAEEQLQLTNQELARATRLKDEFLANMSHELRTPLNAILGMTEGLQEEVFGTINDSQLKALQTIESSGTHLLELINDILDVSKIASGHIELDYAPTSIHHLCQSSLTFIKQPATHKLIQIHTKFQPNLPDLLVDERRIRQVLINLLSNAVKFTAEGGSITLEVSRHQSLTNVEKRSVEGSNDGNNINAGESLEIAVIDTGIGIAPEDFQKLFKPFSQIDGALNRQYNGTGLGLALVKQIVELHGGQVRLTSEVGVGSRFSIKLPYVPNTPISLETIISNDHDRALPLDSPNPHELTAPLILIAEDNEANIMTISTYLMAKGYRIQLAHNGQEAIAVAMSAKPDVILMDIQMPIMDGLEATKQIRQIPSLVNVPIIALTALAMETDRLRCLDAGANEYLAKPVKLKQLANTIHQLLASQEDKHISSI